MKNTLEFEIMGVCRLINHALAAEDWLTGWGDVTAGKPCLQFVHDQGLYLMSNGIPGEPIGENVVYAEGFDPSKVEFDQWWEGARAVVGGDDFVEFLPIDTMLPIPENATGFFIDVTPETMEAGWILAPKAKRPTRVNVTP
jgi:hypothetical protein